MRPSPAYVEFLDRKRRQYAEEFVEPSGSDAVKAFFGTGQRVRVRFAYGAEMTGTVSATTGWRPAFLLMRRSSDMGSPWLIGAGDEIVAVQRGRKYEPLVNA